MPNPDYLYSPLSFRTPAAVHGLSFPKDVSSFLRTGSLSQSFKPTPKLGRSAYAGSAFVSPRTQGPSLRNMFSPTPTPPEERSARKLKKENKFYNFLTNSRSRSHSKTDLSPPEPPRNDRPGSKPPYRIPSRPLSSTTTATNTTITPNSTPKAKKHSPSSIPVSSTRRQAPSEPQDVRRSRPTSPTYSRRKINIFGISIRRPSLSSSKSRSRSRSRPGTPQAVDVPPLPTFGFEDDSRGAAQPSQSPSRPASPPPLRAIPGATTTTTTATPLSLGSLASGSHDHNDPPPPLAQAKDANLNGLEPHVGPSKLRGFFTGKESSSRFRHHSSSGVPADLVSAPVKRAPSFKRRSVNKPLPDCPTSRLSPPPPSPAASPRPSSPPNNSSQPNCIQTISTPATPVRAATISEGKVKPPAAAPIVTSNRTGFGFRNRSLDTGYRYRGTMDVVDEEGRLSRESKDLQQQQQQQQQLRQQEGIAIPRSTSVRKAKDKEPESSTPAPRTGLSRMSTSVRNTKHGSFDFERPGLSAIALQRTGSGGTTTTVTSGWSRNEVSNVRESTWGPGLAGVGTIQRDVSMKRGEEREEKVKEREEKVKEMKKQAKEVAAASAKQKVVVKEDSDPPPPSKTSPSPAHSSNGHQTPPSGTTSGKSSSMSRASGKRFFGKGSSGTRNTHTAQHGLFSFEPPVPSLTWSTTGVITAKEISVPSSTRMEKVVEGPPLPPRKEKQAPQTDIGRTSSQSNRRNKSPVSVPVSKIPTNVGHRSGVKGRSLDLNIGLAWAPSTVREDALLASSSLFKRSLSNSSSVKTTGISRSANSSVHGHDSIMASSPREEDMGMGTELGMRIEEKSRIGREIAEVFRKALGEARYMRFKTYIFQFDAHEIPFDGPTGIISKVDGLLATVPTLGLDEKRRLMDRLVRIILQTA